MGKHINAVKPTYLGGKKVSLKDRPITGTPAICFTIDKIANRYGAKIVRFAPWYAAGSFWSNNSGYCHSEKVTLFKVTKRGYKNVPLPTEDKKAFAWERGKGTFLSHQVFYSETITLLKGVYVLVHEDDDYTCVHRFQV